MAARAERGPTELELVLRAGLTVPSSGCSTGLAQRRCAHTADTLCSLKPSQEALEKTLRRLLSKRPDGLSDTSLDLVKTWCGEVAKALFDDPHGAMRELVVAHTKGALKTAKLISWWVVDVYAYSERCVTNSINAADRDPDGVRPATVQRFFSILDRLPDAVKPVKPVRDADGTPLVPGNALVVLKQQHPDCKAVPRCVTCAAPLPTLPGCSCMCGLEKSFCSPLCSTVADGVHDCLHTAETICRLSKTLSEHPFVVLQLTDTMFVPVPLGFALGTARANDALPILWPLAASDMARFYLLESVETGDIAVSPVSQQRIVRQVEVLRGLEAINNEHAIERAISIIDLDVAHDVGAVGPVKGVINEGEVGELRAHIYDATRIAHVNPSRTPLDDREAGRSHADVPRL